MAGDWIKLEHATPDKPEVHKMAEILGIDPDSVTGKLVRLWIWADQQTIDGNAHSVTKAFLDRYTYVTGFADAMLKTGWLKETKQGFVFPNFVRHNGKTAKKRSLTNSRVSRARNADVTPGALQNDNKSVTREEKRREEKINKESIYILPSINTSGCFSPEERNLLIQFILDYESKHGIKATESTQEEWFRTARQIPSDIRLSALRKAISNSWKGIRDPREWTEPQTGKKPFDPADDSTWPDEMKEIIT